MSSTLTGTHIAPTLAATVADARASRPSLGPVGLPDDAAPGALFAAAESAPGLWPAWLVFLASPADPARALDLLLGMIEHGDSKMAGNAWIRASTIIDHVSFDHVRTGAPDIPGSLVDRYVEASKRVPTASPAVVSRLSWAGAR